MGVTGIVPDEYWDGLAKLRLRLGLRTTFSICVGLDVFSAFVHLPIQVVGATPAVAAPRAAPSRRDSLKTTRPTEGSCASRPLTRICWLSSCLASL